MRYIRISISLVALGTALVTLLYTAFTYLHDTHVKHFNTSTAKSVTQKSRLFTPMHHIPLDEVYRDDPKYMRDYSIEIEDTRTFNILDTPGCRIPLAMMHYKSKLKYNNNVKTCGRRLVYLKKLGHDDIKVTIRDKLMSKLLKTNISYYCCYRYFQKLQHSNDASAKLRYSPCKKIQDGNIFPLESDFIKIQCFQEKIDNSTKTIYSDVYAFAKRKTIDRSHLKKCKKKYNVLMIGMDSMSVLRISQTMPRTSLYLKENSWRSFRGYNKIGDNTLPNLIASITGLDVNILTEKCSNKMDQCNDLFIWNRFKDAGYITAYGEDYLRLPDTFSRGYSFHSQPTDHYMKPFFLNGENEIFNKSLLCAGKIPSGQHLLDYAFDFALTYRKENFFGFFWINSFSHNENNKPEDADNIFDNFFNRLFYTGIFDNTFVIFLSDHGIRFGGHRLKFASYYDNHLPFLFIWPPILFRTRYPNKMKALTINQFRLITPFDLYNTLLEINQMSLCNSTAIHQSIKENPKSQSLFSPVSDNRTCPDAGIHAKWCSCHKLFPLDSNDVEGLKGVKFVVNEIQNKVRSIKTISCMRCAQLTLKNVTRIHFYYNDAKLYYVIAVEMEPENVYYEATVQRKENELELIGPISIISAYRGFGKCTINSKDRVFCVCQKLNNCKAT